MKKVAMSCRVILDGKQYWGMCNDGKYRPIATPISRWLMITE